MTKDSISHTSQDYDRKHQKDHISNNPRAIKDQPTAEDEESNDQSDETAELIAKGHTITDKPVAKSGYAEDKREAARHEHTNHFTNRARPENQ